MLSLIQIASENTDSPPGKEYKEEPSPAEGVSSHAHKEEPVAEISPVMNLILKSTSVSSQVYI